MTYELLYHFGFILFLTGSIWLFIIIFRDDFGFGMFTVILPPVGYFFVKSNWKISRIPFALHIIGVLIIFFTYDKDPTFDRKTGLMYSKDMSVVIKVPDGYGKTSGDYGKDAIIQAADQSKASYIVVQRFPFRGSDLESIINKEIKEFVSASRSSTLISIKEVKVLGMRAIRKELKVTQGGANNPIPFTILITTFKKEKFAFLITNWSYTSRFDYGEYLDIVNSFRFVEKKKLRQGS